MPIGLQFPFSQTTGSLGGLEYTSDEFSAARANIRSLLLTNWGERPMHFHFGCNLVEFLFEPKKNDALRQRIADRISDQLGKWLPYIQLEELVILFSEDDPGIPDNGIGIDMGFRLTGKPNDLDRIFQVIEG